MKTRSFGQLSDGRKAGLYILSNSKGMQAHVTDYGAALVRLIVPDRDGKVRDVVLGYDDAAAYERGQSSFGGTVGRFANRIKNATFYMNGTTYTITANDGKNSLHGGRDFYVHRLWSPIISFDKVSTSDLSSAYAVESMNDWSRVPRGRGAAVANSVPADGGESALNTGAAGKNLSGQESSSAANYEITGDSITFAIDCPDGDQGYPGALHIEVTYTLTEDNELHLDYRAVMKEDNQASDPDAGTASVSNAGETIPASVPDTKREPLVTPLNLTNHSYFNLSGHDSGSVLSQEVWINADQFTEADSESIPTGVLLDVEGTPMDFRTQKAIGRDIEEDYVPLKFGGGYDHNYVLNSCQTGTCGGSAEVKAEQTEQCSMASESTIEDELRICTPVEGQVEYREVAGMYSEDSGIRMSVFTDLPGMQLYTGNFLDGEPGKDGTVYCKRSAACFETQFWPDAVNKENFPGGVLHEGEEFVSRTTYAFEAR